MLLSVSVPVFAADWVLTRVSGNVYVVAPGVKASPAQKGMVLSPGYTIATKSGSRAMLARGQESILVGPKTTFALSKLRSNAGWTTLLQKSGSLVIDVEKRSNPHFSVETPFLAAVVKGTKFGVNVSSNSVSVNVERGLVEVDDFASGDVAHVGPGQAASTSPGNKVGLSVSGSPAPSVRTGPVRAPAFVTPAMKNVPANAAAAAAANGASHGNSNASSSGNANGNSGNANGKGSGNSGNANGNSGNGNGNSNGNSGNGNGNSNGNSGNGNGNSNGNSGNANGNGNSGNANGNGNGNGNSGNANGNSNGNTNGNGNGNGNGR